MFDSWIICGGTENGIEVDVSLNNAVLGGIVGDGFDYKARKSDEKRNLLTISTALGLASSPKIIDYLSLAVKGAEHIIMQDFPLGECKIRFTTVERPSKALRSLFVEKGYVNVNLTISRFGETIWYNPQHIAMSSVEVEGIVRSVAPKGVFPFRW